MGEIFPVETRGIGKPDYSKEVSSGRERPGLTLKYSQTLKIFGLVFTTEIQVIVLAAPGYVNCVPGDIGKMVLDDGGNTAVLEAYDNTSRQWRIAWLPPVLPGSVMTITAGVGSGLALAGVLNPFSWVLPPLAPGGITHFVDNVTGLAMPFTIPKGYTLSLISGSETGNEDSKVWGYLDGFIAASLGIFTSGFMHYESEIVALTTETLDPTGASEHTIDVTAENVGAGNFEGGFQIIGILQEVGTPPLPTTKTIRCKFCGHEEVVPQEISRWICPKCNQLNMFYDLSRFKGTR